jgi:hypothetical protein
MFDAFEATLLHKGIECLNFKEASEGVVPSPEKHALEVNNPLLLFYKPQHGKVIGSVIPEQDTTRGLQLES